MALADTLFSTLQETLNDIEKEYRSKFEDQERTISALQERINELEQYDNRSYREDTPMTQVSDVQSESKYPNENKDDDDEDDGDGNEDAGEYRQKKDPQFWSDLESKFKAGNIKFIKELVRADRIRMDDVNPKTGRNLLMLSTEYGIYELVSMCINLGANIDYQDKKKNTALKICKQQGYPDIEELIRMNMLKGELGAQVDQVTKDLLRRKGLNNNFLRILNELFDPGNTPGDDEKKEDNPFIRGRAITNTFIKGIAAIYKEEVLETMMQIVIQSIKQKVAYSDDILFICFQYEITKKGKLPTQTVLFNTIKEVVVDILAHTSNKKDWYWLKTYVLPSSIWYLKINPNEEKSLFLWYEMFEWVELETRRQSAILSKPMREIENKFLSQWTRLISYDVDTRYKDIYIGVRQDIIPGGLKSEYTATQLTQNVPISQTFNPLVHYDLSQYLTKLLLVCHELNDQFHFDMEQIFQVDKDTKENGKLRCLYMRGPVKKLERCYAKCQSDYRDCAFPTAAHVLDIVRCSLVFEDITSMLKGMDMLQDKIASQKFCIVEIVRVKNGFFEYKHERAQYTDVKFNVIIKGKKYSVIGEVQFLFKRMYDFKRIGHSLYGIERRKEFVDDIYDLLPLKLDLKKQLFIHAARNNVDGITDLMVTHNFDQNMILELNPRKQSILTSVCSTNCEKVFSFLTKSCPLDVIRDRLTMPEQSKSYPLRKAIENNHFNGVLKQIFRKDKYFKLINTRDFDGKTPLKICWEKHKGRCALQVLGNVRSHKDRLTMIEYSGGRITSLQYALWSGNLECCEFLFNELRQDKKLKSQLLSYKTPESKSNYHFACKGGNVECIKLLLDKREDKKRNDELFTVDYQNESPAYQAVVDGQADVLEYMLKQMNPQQKNEFYSTRSAKNSYDPITFIKMKDKAGQSTKEHQQCFKVLVNGLNKDDTRLYSAWLYAAKHNDTEMGKIILDKASNEQVKQDIVQYVAAFWTDGFHTALHDCAEHNATKFMEWMLSMTSDDAEMFTKTTYPESYTPLMFAAKQTNLKCIKLILNKLSGNRKKVNEVLKIKDKDDNDIIQICYSAKRKDKIKCARLLLSYFDKNDISSLFLPCLQLGDVELARAIWKKTNGDRELQNKLLTMQDKDLYNCFLLVCRYGQYESLNWLLSLNEEKEDGDIAAEESIAQKHPINHKTPLILCMENDRRRKPRTKDEKVLTNEEKENYFKCVQYMLSGATSQNKKHLIFNRDTTGKDSIMYAAMNGNIEGCSYLLGQLNDKSKKQLSGRVDYEEDATHFTWACHGGDVELVKKIYEQLYEQYGKQAQVQSDPDPLLVALKYGYGEIVQYILFTLMKDPLQKIIFLNMHIEQAKSERLFVKQLKQWVVDILQKIDIFKDVRQVVNIEKWLLTHSEVNQVSEIALLVSKLPRDNRSKLLFITGSNSIAFACEENRVVLLQKLCDYCEDDTKPIFESNGFGKAIDGGFTECLELILGHIAPRHKKKIITVANLKKAIDMKSLEIVEALIGHFKTDKIIKESFLHAMDNAKIQIAKYLLEQSGDDRTMVLNSKLNGVNVLMTAAKHKKEDCFLFVAEQLKKEQEKLGGGGDKKKDKDKEKKKDEKKDKDKDKDKKENEDQKYEEEIDLANTHPMFLERNDNGSNIFHVLFRTETSMASIEILESVLPRETIIEMLTTRNNLDYLPLYYAFLTNGKEIIEWYLNHFENLPLEKFQLIARRNKFGRSLLHKTTDNKSKFIQETKPFLAGIIHKCLDQLDLNNLEMEIVKDTFVYTMTWQHPTLQALIYNGIPKSQRPRLLTRDDLLHTDSKSIIHQVIESNNIEICEFVLKQISSTKELMYHEFATGYNIVQYGIMQNKGHNVIKYLLDSFKVKQQLIQFLQQRHNRELAAVHHSQNAFGLAYFKGDQKYIQLLSSYISNEQKDILLHAAMRNDQYFDITPKILKDIKSKELKYKLLHSVDEDGSTLLQKACCCDYRTIMDWIVNQEITEMDDPLMTLTDFATNEIALLRITSYFEYGDFIRNGLTKMSAQNMLSLIAQKNYFDESFMTRCHSIIAGKIVKCIGDALKVLDQDKNSKVFNDANAIFPYFDFVQRNINSSNDENSQLIKFILSKVSPIIQRKLLMNYESGRSFNLLSECSKILNKKGDILLYVLQNIKLANMDEVMQDTENPDFATRESILNKYCSQPSANFKTFKVMLSMYDDNKENNQENILIKPDQNNKTVLYCAMVGGNVEIIEYIMNKIKKDLDKITAFNRQTTANSNIFDIVYDKSAKAKELIKTAVIAILRNLKDNQIKSSQFVPYFHWICNENDSDSVDQLLNIFKNDKTYIERLLKSIHPKYKESPLHVAIKNRNIETVKYLLKFIDSKNDKLMEEIFSLTDINGRTIFMICCEENERTCLDLLIKKLKNSTKLLSSLILATNPANQTCVDIELAEDETGCTNIILNSGNISDEVYQMIFFAAIKNTKNAILDKVIAKMGLNKLLDERDANGNNALALFLIYGNIAYIKMILKLYDKNDDEAIHKLLSFRNFNGETLLHLAVTSLNIYDCPKAIINMCEDQKVKREIFLSVDLYGRNVEYVYIQHGIYIQKSNHPQIGGMSGWLCGNLRKPDDKLQFMTTPDLDDKIPIDCNFVIDTEYGAKEWLPMIVKKHIPNGNAENMYALSTILSVALRAKYAPCSLIKKIVKKYENKKDQLKMLSTKNASGQNAFYIASASNNLDLLNIWRYLLGYINKDNVNLLLQPSTGTAMDNDTCLHKIINNDELSAIMLEKFDSYQNLLNLVNDENKTVLRYATRTSMSLLLLKQLQTEDEKIQYFIDTLDDKIESAVLDEDEFDNDNFGLFGYFEDHAETLMSKLLSATTSKNNDSLLMVIFKYSQTKIHLFNWLFPYIQKLSDNDRLTVLQQINNLGENVLHIAAKVNYTAQKNVLSIDPGARGWNVDSSAVPFMKLLSLFPSDKAKEDAILRRDNLGKTPFQTVFEMPWKDDWKQPQRPSIFAAHIMLQELNNPETKLKLFSCNSSFDITEKQREYQNNWKQWATDIFSSMPDLNKTMDYMIAPKQHLKKVSSMRRSAIFFQQNINDMADDGKTKGNDDKKQDEDNMGSKDKYIDNVLLLIPLFRLAVYQNDMQFAKQIIARINAKNHNKILQFITTKLPSRNNENCLHFAAYSKYGKCMELLINLVSNNINDYDIIKIKNKLLMNKEMLNGNNENILTIAAKNNNPRIIKYVLSMIKNKKDRQQLISMRSIYNGTNINSVIMCLMSCQNDIECLKLLLSKDIYDKNSIRPIIAFKTSKNETIYHYIRTPQQCQYLERTFGVQFTFKQFNVSDNDGNTMFMNAVKNAKQGNISLIEFILSRCNNDDEKLQLIHQYNKNGENSLDLAKYTDYQYPLVSTIKSIIISKGTSIKAKDVQTIMIPLFLWSLKMGKISLSKWLMSKVINNNDKKKLINCSNKFGINGLMSAAMGAQPKAMHYLFAHHLFDINMIKDKDVNGLNITHYACFNDDINTLSFVVHHASKKLALAAESKEDNGFFSIPDNFGKIPYDYVIEKCGINSDLNKWICRRLGKNMIKRSKKLSLIERSSLQKQGKITYLQHLTSDSKFKIKCASKRNGVSVDYAFNSLVGKLRQKKSNIGFFGSGEEGQFYQNIGNDSSYLQQDYSVETDMNEINFMRTHQNKNEQIIGAMTEKMNVRGFENEQLKYIENSKFSVYRIELASLNMMHFIRNKYENNDDNQEEKQQIDPKQAGYHLFYLSKNNWSLLKLIVNKLKQNQDSLNNALNVKNSSNETILHNICKNVDNQFIINWYLTKVIPKNHPILFAKDSINGDTAFMLLIKNGLLNSAQLLLDCIVNKREKLKLIETKNNKNETILDYAKRENISRVNYWIQNQIKTCSPSSNNSSPRKGTPKSLLAQSKTELL